MVRENNALMLLKMMFKLYFFLLILQQLYEGIKEPYRWHELGRFFFVFFSFYRRET